jgi:DNA-3-methyladenine glycosylase I
MSKRANNGIVRGLDGRRRCFWCAATAEYQRYHDTEWGYPVADDRRLFEKICLEGFQAGLSWLTILRKRAAFRAAFVGFDFERIARFTPRHVERLLADAGIIRHRGKIESAINNAQRASDLVDEYGSLARYVWQFEALPQSRPARLTREVLRTLATSPESVAMSRDLKKRGWTFVGPTTLYAFMQAVGLVNDHLHGCDIRAEAERSRRGFKRP